MRSGHSRLEIAPERFDLPDVVSLTEAQQEELRCRYEGIGDIGPSRDAAMFEPPHGLFLVGRLDGRAVACGGVCRFDGTRAELKRMYVTPEVRGFGFGRRILEALEGEARRLAYTRMVLETGERQLESLGLYTSSGYEQIPCYGPYAQRAWSRCFEKIL
jgi:GNAT superfamily N-acetyltransferase